MTTLTKEATAPLGVKPRDADRSKNFFALGVVSWLYSRPTEATLAWIEERFANNALVRDANRAAYLAGFNFGETTELWDHRYEVRPAPMAAGEYTNVTGNTALAWGLVVAGQLANLPVTLGSYPITPASDILHELAKHKNFGVRTFQAEDEIAACGAALGAAFAGHLGVTTTSGPGVALKSETMSLAISLELPLLLVDIQRGGPSTGLPTKTEAADLLIALYGRHAEAPLPVVAAFSPTHCFFAAIEAARLALKYRTPVILLSDGYLANGAEPWRLPDVADLPDISVPFATETNHVDDDGTTEFWPYLRDPDTLARPWAIPGHARPAAPRRRAGEGGRHRQHRLHAGEPQQDGAAPRRQGGRHRQRHPGRDGGGRRGRRAADRAAGGAPGRPSTPRCSRPGGGVARWRGPTWSTSTRSRPTSATSCAATRRS